MKKLLLFVILLFAFSSQAQTGYAVIAAEDVNFRKSPETTSEVIRMVKLGTLAKVLEGPVEKNSKNWYKIQIGTQGRLDGSRFCLFVISNFRRK